MPGAVRGVFVAARACGVNVRVRCACPQPSGAYQIFNFYVIFHLMWRERVAERSSNMMGD